MKKTLSLLSLIFLLASASFAADITWIEKTPMPVSVSVFGYTIVDGNIYIIGGDSSGTSMTTVQRYNLASDTWETDTNNGGTLAPLPQPRAVLFCGVIDRKVHAIGGWENGTYKGDHFIYDPDTNTWSNGPAIPQYPIGQFAATVNNKIYVFGGWWGTYKDNVFEYSEGVGWSSKTLMPTARAHGTTAAYDGKIYVIAGQGGQPAQQQPLDVVEMYDPESDSWTTGLAPMPSQQHWLGSSGSPVLDGIIYVLGPGNTAYGYDPEADSWNTFSSMPDSAVGIAAINGLIWAIGPEHTFQGVSSPWCMFHHDAQHTGRSPYLGPQEETVGWTYDTGGEVNSSPAIDRNGTIYVGSEDYKLYALNPDGTLKWTYPTGGGIYSSPAIGHDGIIYVGSRDHNLYAIKPDGTLKWIYTTGGEICASPTIGHDGTIYIGSYDSKLYALNPDGTLKCEYSAGGVIHSTAAIGLDGVIYVGSSNGRLNALYPDCTLKWISDPAIHGIWTHPAISPDGTAVYHGADDGYLYARNTSDGSVKWKSPFTYGGVQSSPAIGGDGTIYVGTQYGYLWALNPEDGSLKWDNYTTLSAWSSPAIGADGTIYFATNYGHVYAMNQDGTVKWIYNGNFNNDGHFHSSPAIGSNGALYIGCTKGKIYAFGSTLCKCDLNHDGRCDMEDWLLFGEDWGRTDCPH
jgi:outer membrane protein assembly factor BamB